MEMRVVWRSLRRRWYLVLALAVLTLGATFLVAQRVGETYEATGTVLVFPPSQTEGPTGEMSEENPYLSLGGVGQARDVVVRALTSKQVGDAFGEDYPVGTTYEIVPDYTNSAPIILFTVEAATPDVATEALSSLIDRVPVELEKLQIGAGPARQPSGDVGGAHPRRVPGRHQEGDDQGVADDDGGARRDGPAADRPRRRVAHRSPRPRPGGPGRRATSPSIRCRCRCTRCTRTTRPPTTPILTGRRRPR